VQCQRRVVNIFRVEEYQYHPVTTFSRIELDFDAALPLSPTYQSAVTNRLASHYTCTTGTADQVYVVLASLADDSLLFPLLVVILYSSFRLCAAFLSFICQFHLSFMTGWQISCVITHVRLRTIRLLNRPSLIYDMIGAAPLLVHYHHIPYDS
jgi:hypothetical protein